MKDNKVFKEKFERAKTYWQDKFSGEINSVYLPLDFERSREYQKGIHEIRFPGPLAARLLSLSKNQDALLYVVLLAALKVLLFKYSSIRQFTDKNKIDVSVGAPVYVDEKNKPGDSSQPLIIFRDLLVNQMAFKELLVTVKQTVVEGYENQYYVVENILDVLGVKLPRRLLSRVIFLLENIHQKVTIDHISHSTDNDITITLIRNNSQLKGYIQYNANIFNRDTIRRLWLHYLQVLEGVAENINVKLKDLDVISEQDKMQILYEFNNTEKDYPQDTTLHLLFENQVEKTPGNTAVIYENQSISYQQLNEKANQLAKVLRAKGVNCGDIIGLIIESSVETGVGLLGVLKAGAAYLPIDPGYPSERKKYMLRDSHACIVVIQQHLENDRDALINLSLEPILIEEVTASVEVDADPCPTGYRQSGGSDKAYLLYTSGTTGLPKGVIALHRGIVNYTSWRLTAYQYTEKDVTLQMLSYSFDGFGSNFYSSLLSGGMLLMIPDEKKLAFDFLKESIIQCRVTNMSLVPTMYRMLLDHIKPGELENLRLVVLAGEKTTAATLEESRKKMPGAVLVNEYGPTEASVTAAANLHYSSKETFTAVIGSPIANTHIYILDATLKLLPVNVPGELCVAGVGVTRGYLNRPELTAEKFCLRRPGGRFLKKLPPWTPRKNFLLRGSQKDHMQSCSHASMHYYFHSLYYPITPSPHHPIYRTGDCARWLSDGTLQLLGRIDKQVKIRGFRIELGEIENQLMTHGDIKEAVVIAGSQKEKPDQADLETSPEKKSILSLDDKNEERYLCAYIVSRNTIEISELREYLSVRLPTYMVPSYFVIIEKIPLTSNGKVNFRALPAPQHDAEKEYAPPGNEQEKQLVRIWSEVLGIDLAQTPIGIDDDFFKLGGHSLNATILVSKIHKEMNVRVPLSEVFKSPTIRALSGYINDAVTTRFVSIEPAEKKECYPLSSAQNRLYMLQQVDRDSTAYNLPQPVEMEDDINLPQLEDTFRKLIRRHESLRTSFELVEGNLVQRIHPDPDFKIQHNHFPVSSESGNVNMEKLFKEFIRPFDLSCAPLVRAHLVKTGNPGSVLVVDMHHIISDGVSYTILLRDFTRLYQGKDLPPMKLQYKDFTQWENQLVRSGRLKQQEEYWLQVFADQVPVLNMPTDYPRPDMQTFEGEKYYFKIDRELAKKIKEMTAKTQTTLHIYLLAVYYIFLAKYTGQEDITVGSPIAGRTHDDLHDIIGMFVNMLALRNKPRGNITFTEFLEEVKENALQAYDNQEYQFNTLVERLGRTGEAGRHPLAETIFLFQNPDTEKKKNQTSQTDLESEIDIDSQEGGPKISKFDLKLAGREEKSAIIFNFEYYSKLFKRETIQRMSTHFINTLEIIAANPGIKISKIDILTGDEKVKLLKRVKGERQNLPGKRPGDNETTGKKVEAEFDL